MKKFFRILKKISDVTNTGAKFLIITIMFAMLSFTVLQVLYRYVLGSALSWPEEVNIFFLTWITFVGSSIGIKASEHLSVDLFVNKLPPIFYWIVRLFGHLVMNYIAFLIIRHGLIVAMKNVNVFSDALEIPMVIPRFSLVVGGVMMFIQALYILGEDMASCPWVMHGLKKNTGK